jgi:hypothetical protein
MGNPKYESQRIEKNEKRHQQYTIAFTSWNPMKLVLNENDKVTNFEVHLSKPLTVAEVRNRVDKMLNVR